MSRRKKQHRWQVAQHAAPSAEPDLFAELAKNREQTAQLVRGLDAHMEQAELLLKGLNQQQLSTDRLLRGLTEILGSFDRLLAYDSDVDLESYRASVRKTADVLVDTLWNNGMELIGKPGEIAEPDTHHVVELKDVQGMQKDAVITVFQRGIRYQDRLVRPASVVVSSGKAAQESSPE